MHSIRTKITAMTVGVIVAAMVIAALLGVSAIKQVGTREAEQSLLLLCETGQKNLNRYFESAEQSVDMTAAFVRSDLDGLDDDALQAHLDRTCEMFRQLAYKTNGVLTYYYRIDPEVSENVKGFWYVNLDGTEFQEHDVTDISVYDTADTSQLVWFTVPKANGKASSAVWLPPYTTENLDMRVLSYNVPIYYGNTFVGVIGIEIDFSSIAEVVDSITLYDNGYAFLNDEEGNVIYHPRMDVTTMESQPKVPEGLLSSDKFIEYEFEGVKKQACWLPLSNGMHLNVSVPVSEINAVWHKWNTAIAVSFALLLLLFVILIMTFAGRITKPLGNLTEAAEQISRGNYDCDLDYEGKDEIGILTDSFRKVTGNLKNYISSLNEMAFTDALTGIRNRMALRHDYDSYEGHEVAVMMLDLNEFKVINDTHGHDEGDRILRETAALLRDTFGSEHCYRYGGDEFLVIVPDCTAAEFREKLDQMNQHKPVIEGEPAGFSIGYVHAVLNDSEMLRSLISAADEKMYETKRDTKHTPLPEHELEHAPMKASEYSVGELKSFLEEMSGKYDLARVVDPIECRIIELQDDGKINMNESCYGIWNAEQKCINCSSSIACRTGCHQEKAEKFRDNFYFIQSNPVKLRLSNGSVYDAVVELVNVEQESEGAVNNREAENIGTRAAHYLAHHDSLTNVLNADAFYELSRELIKNSPEQSWVMISGNIMDFRLVNALFGVIRGNEVLVKTASLLKEYSEEAKGLSGRLGGDQFAVLVPKRRYREGKLEVIAKTLKKTFSSGTYTFCIHFGVYEIDDPSIPVSVMCGRANSALRTIREDMTRTVAQFNDEMRQKILQEQLVIGGFEDAMKNGEIRMYLQPLVEADGSVFGAEELARWVRPDGTMIMPQDFIETLENAGRIQQLDVYMWELAVQRLASWKDTSFRNLCISVNVSAKDFYSLDVYEVLTALVDRYGVNSRQLRLEITETALLGEPEKSNAVLAKLRERGFLVEIDDFGKGNSSLSLIRSIKADVLKIDMSLTQEISDQERSRIILKSLISLADSLGMDVITEGVETEHQLETLIEMGCAHFQGFYFSRPLSPDAFEAKCSELGIASA